MNLSQRQSNALQSLQDYRIPSGQLDRLRAFLDNPDGESYQLIGARNLSFDFGAERVLRCSTLPERQDFVIYRQNQGADLEKQLGEIGVYLLTARKQIAAAVSKFLDKVQSDVLEGGTLGSATAYVCYRRGSDPHGAKWNICDNDNARSRVTVLQKVLISEIHLAPKISAQYADLDSTSIATRNGFEIFEPSESLRRQLSMLPKLEGWGNKPESQGKIIADLVRLDSCRAIREVSDSEIAVLNGGMTNGAIFREPASLLFEDLAKAMHTVSLKVVIEKV